VLYGQNFEDPAVMRIRLNIVRRRGIVVDLRASEVAALSWGDAEFRGFVWEPAQSGANLRLFLAPADHAGCDLVCEWASHLRVDLDYKQYIGAMPTWEVRFVALPKDRWRVSIDVSPVGEIEFECNSLGLDHPSRAPAA
jgi:hypothetical protein